VRTSKNAPLDPKSFPAPRFLAERVFSRNFTERLIWIGLLRSLKPCELEPKLKAYLGETAKRPGTDDCPAFITREMAIAWATGALGEIPDHPDLERFFTRAGISWNAMLKAGLRTP
jgi:hypothetical protein